MCDQINAALQKKIKKSYPELMNNIYVNKPVYPVKTHWLLYIIVLKLKQKNIKTVLSGKKFTFFN